MRGDGRLNYILSLLVVLGVIIYGLVVYVFGWCHSREFYMNKKEETNNLNKVAKSIQKEIKSFLFFLILPKFKF